MQLTDRADKTDGHPFGVGAMPSSLYRFNWGAFFMPFFWAVAFGAWPVLAVWSLGFAAPVLFGVLAGPAASQLPVFIALAVASEITAGVVRLWAGVSANRIAWRRDQLRLDALPDSRPRFTVGRFADLQRKWALWGAIVLAVVSIVGTAGMILVPALETAWSEYGLAVAGPLMTFVWLAVEVVLGLWLDVRMKAEPPPTQAPTGAA